MHLKVGSSVTLKNPARTIGVAVTPPELMPFSGSGTTIIAAEQTERRCYAMEISPVYCDLAVKRWEDFTGEKAVRLEG